MTKGLRSFTYLRFAGVSLVVVAAITAGIALAGAELIRAEQDRAAARSSDALIASPIRSVLASAPSAPVLQTRLDQVAGGMVSDDVRGIRLITDGGFTAYAAGTSLGDGRMLAGDADLRWSRRETPDGGSGFITAHRAGVYSIEVWRNPAAINSAIGRTRMWFFLLLGTFALTAFLLLQAAFWFGVRRFARVHRRLLYLYTTGQEIRSSLDLHEVVTHLTRDGAGMANARYGLIALFEAETGDVMLRATFDRETGAIAHQQRPVEEWFLRRAAATGTTVTTTQPAAAFRALFSVEDEVSGDAALMVVPMSVRERVVALIAVMRQSVPRRRDFSANEINLVEELARQGVMAVEQALLFAKVQSYADELELSYDTTLKVLMAALDTKDDVTEGHCERVAKLTVELAKTVDITDTTIVDIERGALLHDVGKIGVPDAVLRKPDVLNRMEWEAMQKHPLLAGLMVSKVGFLEGALPILLYHHERYDGSGYPFGLAGDKIPLEARIFSVVDSYDAMTSDRPYRDAMRHEAAMEEIRTNSETQFDPEIVTAFEQLMATRPELRQRGRHRISSEHNDHDADLPRAQEHAA